MTSLSICPLGFSVGGNLVKSCYIDQIERVQNPSLYRQYMLHKEEMKKRSQRPSAIERSLWHGTSAEATQSINVGGFNRSYCGKNG